MKSKPPSARRPTLRELPPLNPPPARPSPSPDAVPTPAPKTTEKFYSEPPTKQKNVVASVYQSLLSVFDEMSPEQRMEFVDLASRYTALDAPARGDLLEFVSLFVSLDAHDRAEVLATAKSLID